MKFQGDKIAWSCKPYPENRLKPICTQCDHNEFDFTCKNIPHMTYKNRKILRKYVGLKTDERKLKAEHFVDWAIELFSIRNVMAMMNWGYNVLRENMNWCTTDWIWTLKKKLQYFHIMHADMCLIDMFNNEKIDIIMCQTIHIKIWSFTYAQFIFDRVLNMCAWPFGPLFAHNAVESSKCFLHVNVS